MKYWQYILLFYFKSLAHWVYLKTYILSFWSEYIYLVWNIWLYIFKGNLLDICFTWNNFYIFKITFYIFRSAARVAHDLLRDWPATPNILPDPSPQQTDHPEVWVDRCEIGGQFENQLRFPWSHVGHLGLSEHIWDLPRLVLNFILTVYILS